MSLIRNNDAVPKVFQTINDVSCIVSHKVLYVDLEGDQSDLSESE